MYECLSLYQNNGQAKGCLQIYDFHQGFQEEENQDIHTSIVHLSIQHHKSSAEWETEPEKKTLSPQALK